MELDEIASVDGAASIDYDISDMVVAPHAGAAEEPLASTSVPTEHNMSTVWNRSKDYEMIAVRAEPHYARVVSAVQIIVDFIVANKLVVYGGTAIDFALRLKGDKIYPDDMLQIPDLDFFSPTNVEHAYMLADVLYHAGYTEARAICAEHMETMRVDVVDNHFLADITYRPQAAFDSLPFIEFNGMRVVHPLFQRIDLHSALGFPYDGPPREVIFARWSKDITRFNKLDAAYPVMIAKRVTTPTRSITLPTSLLKYVLSGFAAYAVYATLLAEDKTNPFIPAKFEIRDDRFIIDTYDSMFEVVHYNPVKLFTKHKFAGAAPHYYEPYVNMIPERLEIDCAAIDGAQLPAPVLIKAYSTQDRLVAVNNVDLPNHRRIRVVGIQYLLKHFISMHFVAKSNRQLSELYLSRYQSLLAMTNIDSPHTAPSIITYGNDNVNLARRVALSRLYGDLDSAPRIATPSNYYPGRSIPANRPHPVFDPATIEFFHEEGREIELPTVPTDTTIPA